MDPSRTFEKGNRGNRGNTPMTQKMLRVWARSWCFLGPVYWACGRASGLLHRESKGPTRDAACLLGVGEGFKAGLQTQDYTRSVVAGAVGPKHGFNRQKCKFRKMQSKEKMGDVRSENASLTPEHWLGLGHKP